MSALACRDEDTRWAVGHWGDWSEPSTVILVLSWWQFFPFPGLLHDKLGAYDVAFYLAGIPPLIGGAVLCFIPWVHSKKQQEVTKATGGEKMEKMLENQNSVSSSAAMFKKESASVI